MDDTIEWKEAKCGQATSDSDIEEQEFKIDSNDLDYSEQEMEGDSVANHDFPSTMRQPSSDIDDTQQSQYRKTFSHKHINLSLRRNITALADANQHKPKLTYASENQHETFDSWLSQALVAISPTADLLLFAGQSPEKITFIAKLRMDPINQYTTKQLTIPLDYDEQVTSVLCLPIMSIQKTANGLVDWTALVVGLSSGYVKFYTEQSICLLSLKFCDEPVLNLRCQTQKNNTNARSETHFPAIADELLIQHRTIAIVADGLGLYENLRVSKSEVVKSNSSYEPAYDLTNLPTILVCQKWKIDHQRGSVIVDGELLGTRRSSTFNSLLSESINLEEHIPAKAYARSLALAGRDPFISFYHESGESSSHSYTELIGSIFSLWNKPQPSRSQISEVSNASTVGLFDKDRLSTSIVSSPDKRMAAVTDDFGRVLLVDISNWLVVRVWKGYRSAQCGWIEVKRNPEKRNCPHASFLVIYAPRRGLLEVWSAQRGPRVAAFNVGKHCRLLYSGYKMLNMRAESLSKTGNAISLTEQSYSSHCYLLNAKSETIFCVELPYTYSLYKYGDLKSRDHLLIAELTTTIQQDVEAGLISEILHRITLAESIYRSILKIAYGLGPDKVIKIMENLINKTMRNYDNHSGEPMTVDDKSIIELCKRILRLCIIFKELSDSTPNVLSLPDLNQRLIYQYEEHPQEIDEFAEKLGWSASEILRYLSFLALDRSYRASHISNPWPDTGEPLTWPEFISCFDLKPKERKYASGSGVEENSKNQDRLSIKLKEFNGRFLIEDRVMKTALFMYNHLSESYYRSSQENATKTSIINSYNFLEPSSRLALLVQFWLSTKLCNDWKMWLFLQNQIGQISDELKVIAMDQKDDKILIETWKQIYNLILESDNIFAAIIATATIKSDTLRMIKDNEKREKLEAKQESDSSKVDSNEDRSSIDWECLCIDAERMSILSQELEDVFLLNLLLKYSPNDGHLVEGYFYRVPRISVANVLRGGPTIVSELVAQWAVQSEVNLKIFNQPYGSQTDDNDEIIITNPPTSSSSDKKGCNELLKHASMNLNNEEQAKELLHHAKAAFPCSLEPDVILMNCVWEFCRQWANNISTTNRTHLLKHAYKCLPLLSSTELKHKLANVAYKTFFQRTFERLVILVETNSTVVNLKSSRLRDTLTRKELNMGEECLEDFVQFCCDLSEFMLQTGSYNNTNESIPNQDSESSATKNRLLTYDRWWTTPTVVKMLDDSNSKHYNRRRSSDFSFESGSSSSDNGLSAHSLVKTVLFTTNLLDVNFLVELNSLANLVNLIFKLKVVKSYPASLIGEESRQKLQIDLHHSPTTGNAIESKNRATPVQELRLKFARRCIMNLVTKMAEEMSEFNDMDAELNDDDDDDDIDEDIGTRKALSSSTNPIFDIADRQQQVGNLSSGSRHKIGSASAAAATTGTSSNKLPEDIDRTSPSTSGLLLLDDADSMFIRNENNESMVLFANLLSLAKDWQLNCDELYLELVFELYRCNLDKTAAQISNRILDQQTLANGLLKISSQRVLVLFGLSPQVSSSEWKRRSDKWSIFQPNVASWLKSIQQEETRREIAGLSFTDSLKTSPMDENNAFGVQSFVLRALRKRTKLVLELITNHLDGQAGRLAYDLLQVLKSSQLFVGLWADNNSDPSPS